MPTKIYDQEIEVRLSADTNVHFCNNLKASTLEGYLVQFGDLSDDLGGFKERIHRGAFRNCDASGEVLALYCFDPKSILGRTDKRTLRLQEDSQGLTFAIYPKSIPEAIRTSIITDIKRNNVFQICYRFKGMQDFWEKSDGQIIRNLIDIRLLGISLFTTQDPSKANSGQRNHPGNAYPITTKISNSTRLHFLDFLEVR